MADRKSVVRHGFGGVPGWLVYLLAAVAFGGLSAVSVAGLGSDRPAVRALSITVP